MLDASKKPVVPDELLPAFFDLNGDGNQGGQSNFMYANATLTYNDILAAQIGFSKQVAGAGDAYYADHTTVPLMGGYSYLLRRVNEGDQYVKDIIIYDVLEEAHDGLEHWKGKFLSIDASQLESKGIDVIKYYSTVPGLVLYDAADQAGAAARRDLTNTAIWSAAPPSDLSTVTAVAVDLRHLKTGEEFIAKPSEVLALYVFMEAPMDENGSLVDNQILAYNENLMSSSVRYATQQDFSEIATEQGNTVTVALKDIGIDLSKESEAISGTQDAPTPVQAQDEILYRLHLTNTNLADAIENITLEDTLPDGLTIDFANISLMRMDNPGTTELVAASAFASVTQDGQKLTFTIPNLLAHEKVTFLVPTTVDHLLDPLEDKVYENRAKITKVYDLPYEKESPPIWHQIWPATAAPQGVKTMLNRPFLPGETFTFELREGTDGNGEVVRTATAVAPADGDMPAQLSFVFPALGYDMVGTHSYTITEVPGNGDSVLYDEGIIGVTITVTLVEGRLQAAVAYTKEGAPVDQAEFSNEFLTTTFTQRKQWQGETQLGRPRIRLQLYRDGQTFGEGVYLPLEDGDAMWTTDSWEYTWENLPRLKADGSGPSV